MLQNCAVFFKHLLDMQLAKQHTFNKTNKAADRNCHDNQQVDPLHYNPSFC